MILVRALCALAVAAVLLLSMACLYFLYHRSILSTLLAAAFGIGCLILARRLAKKRLGVSSAVMLFAAFITLVIVANVMLHRTTDETSAHEATWVEEGAVLSLYYLSAAVGAFLASYLPFFRPDSSSSSNVRADA